MGKFLVVSGTVVLSVILFGAVLLPKSTARSAPTCAEGPQDLRVRCTRLMIDKHKPKKEKHSHGQQAMPGTRCLRLTNGSYKRGSMLPNTPPTVEIKTSVDKVTLSCKSGQTPTVCATDAKVQLRSIASDADGDSLLYTYYVTGGRISGDGPAVVWDLSGLEAGSYTATVEVDDGCGCINSVDATVPVIACPNCKPQ